MLSSEKETKLKIDIERCKGCAFCVQACPRKALVLSEDVNKRGRQYAILKFPEKCTACGICTIVCPDCSIEIEG